MLRTPRAGRRWPTRVGAGAVLALLAVGGCSTGAAADDGRGPFGVTSVAAPTGPHARVGALFPADRAARLPGGHFCTASVVHSPGRDLIVSAAHCLDGEDDLVFVPGYRDGRAPYGVWTVTRRYLSDAWTSGEDADADVGFAAVAARADGGIEDVVGANRLVTGTETGADPVTVTGYPDSREVPVACTARAAVHSRTQQRIDCPGFTGGTSGSPWVTADGRVVGVLGGYQRGGATADVSYSVVLGPQAAGLYRVAEAGAR
ncbi:trypsin-like peptidase domain-containing protein [Streptomyces sp. NPDC008150]|uniref:trypsin-like serine peptidase n=1 Tax=Streptomyces sp. NPDC008150 TaxID=3364816 RepID=UPI0036E7F5E1